MGGRAPTFLRAGAFHAVSFVLSAALAGWSCGSRETSSTTSGAAVGGGGGTEALAGRLEGLAVSRGALSPAFSPNVTSYTIDVPFAAASVDLTPTASPGASVTVNDAPLPANGTATVDRALGKQLVTVEVLGAGGSTSYIIEVRRGLALSGTFKGVPALPGAECGSALATSGTTLVMGCYRHVEPSDANPELLLGGAVFVFEREGSEWAFVQKLMLATGSAEDRFGTSVALEGSLLVVGAPGHSANAGRAFVFEKDDAGVWTQRAAVAPKPGQLLDLFGSSVAISGSQLAIGAMGEDGGASGINGVVDESAPGAGAAYIFTRVGDSFTFQQEAYVKAAEPSAGDLFGSALALRGDQLAVAAIGEDSAAGGVGADGKGNGAVDSGAVFIYRREAAGWTYTTRIKGPSPNASDAFGSALALHSDGLLVGIPGDDATGSGVGQDADDEGALDSGAAALYRRDAKGEWSLEAHFKSHASTPYDGFGAAVALDGHLLAVGAPREDGSGKGLAPPVDEASLSSGAVYSFRQAGSWLLDGYVKAPVDLPGQRFGSAVALGADEVFAGAPYDDTDAVDGEPSTGITLDAGASYALW